VLIATNIHMMEMKMVNSSEELEDWMKELGVTLTELKCRKCSVMYKSINPIPSDNLCFDCWLDLDEEQW
jgi:hypothetical protein